MALPPPIVAGGGSSALVAGGPLDLGLNDRLAKSRFKNTFLHMGIALADLTTIGEDPDGSGALAVPVASNANVDAELPVGSLSKIAAMFAAFRLRNRVRIAAAAALASVAARAAAAAATPAVAAGVAAGSAIAGISAGRAIAGGIGTQTANDPTIDAITSEWRPIVSHAINKPPNDFPNLNRIFDFGSQPLKFKDDGKDLIALHSYHDSSKARIDGLSFAERMKLMIRYSDNMAAGSCVRDVGFQYMNASLAADGFADKARNGILWLGGDFGYSHSPPIMGAPPWSSGANATWVRASARGIVSFLTLMWANRLVDKESSQEMRQIMLEASVGFATFLSNATKGKVRAWSKIGLLGSVISEGVIIEAVPPGSFPLRYAGVGLGAPNEQTMTELAQIFQDSIAAVHPMFSPKPQP